MSIIRFHNNRLRLRVQNVVRQGFRLDNGICAGFQLIDLDNAVFIRRKNAVCRGLPLIPGNQFTAGSRNLKLHAFQRFSRNAVFFDHDKPAFWLVEKLNGVRPMVFNLNRFGRIVQQEARFGLHFLNDVTRRFQVGDHDESAFIRAEFSARSANRRTVCACNFENHVGKRFFGYGVHLFNEQPAKRFIFNGDFRCFPRCNGRCARSGIELIAVLCTYFRNRISAIRQIIELDLPTAVRRVRCGRVAVALDFKGYAGNRFAGDAVDFFDNQTALFRVQKSQSLCVVLIHTDGLRRRVHYILIRHLDLGHDIRAGGQLGKRDLPVFVGLINAVRTRRALKVGDKFAGRCSDFKLNIWYRFARLTVLFQHDQAPFGLVPKFQTHGFICFDFNSLRSIVQNVAGTRARLLRDYGHAGFQPVYADRACAVGHKFAVGISN